MVLCEQCGQTYVEFICVDCFEADDKHLFCLACKLNVHDRVEPGHRFVRASGCHLCGGAIAFICPSCPQHKKRSCSKCFKAVHAVQFPSHNNSHELRIDPRYHRATCVWCGKQVRGNLYRSLRRVNTDCFAQLMARNPSCPETLMYEYICAFCQTKGFTKQPDNRIATDCEQPGYLDRMIGEAQPLNPAALDFEQPGDRDEVFDGGHPTDQAALGFDQPGDLGQMIGEARPLNPAPLDFGQPVDGDEVFDGGYPADQAALGFEQPGDLGQMIGEARPLNPAPLDFGQPVDGDEVFDGGYPADQAALGFEQPGDLGQMIGEPRPLNPAPLDFAQPGDPGRVFDGAQPINAIDAVDVEEISDDALIEKLSERFPFLSDENKTKVTTLVRGEIVQHLSQFRAEVKQMPRDVQTLKKLTPEDFLKKAPKLVLHLLDVRPERNSAPKAIQIVNVLEGLLMLLGKRLVCPIAFKEAALLYYTVRSKIAHFILSNRLPCGSYTSVWNFFKQGSCQGEIPNHLRDVKIGFDNQQKVNKSHHVQAWNKAGGKTECTAVYTGFCDSYLQLNEEMDPAVFLGKGHHKLQNMTAEEVESAVTLTSEEEKVLTFEVKLLFHKAFKRAQEEHDCDYKQYLEEVAQLWEVETYRCSICPNCESICGQSWTRCDKCSFLLDDRDGRRQVLRTKLKDLQGARPDEVINRHYADFVNLDHVTKGEQLDMEFFNGEPIFEMPNSYARIVRILRELGKRYEVKPYGTARNFVVITVDGQPYSMIVEIKKKYFKCGKCDRHFTTGTDSLPESQHRAKCDGTFEDAQFEFDWIILEPGYGHVEMNILRTILKRFWKPYFEDTAKCLGFTSQKQLDYAQRGTDTHKSFEMLFILREAIVAEIAAEFVLTYKLPMDKANLRNLKQFLELPCAPQKMKQLYDFLIDDLMPLFMLRIGMRFNEPTYVSCAMKMSLTFFLGCDSPKYKRIVTHHLLQRSLLPERLREFMDKTQSIPGRNGRGQGMDFRVEEEIKKSLSHLPNNAAPHHFKEVYANLQDLAELRESTFTHHIGAADPSHHVQVRKPRNFSREVEKLRIVVMDNDYMNIERSTNLRSQPIDVHVDAIIAHGEERLQELIKQSASEHFFRQKQNLPDMPEEESDGDDSPLSDSESEDELAIILNSRRVEKRHKTAREDRILKRHNANDSDQPSTSKRARK